MKGTADAIKTAESYVKEDFLLVYGDLLTTPNSLKTLIETHLEKKPAVSMAVVQVDHPEHYGIVNIEDNLVVDVIEKPKPNEAPTNLANAGIYVFTPEIFETIRQTPLSPRGELEITDSFKLLIRENRRILGVEISRKDWFDIGRPWDLLEANTWALSRVQPKVDGVIEDETHLIGLVRVEEGARIRSGAYIEGPVFIGEDSDIGPNCYIRPYTHIGKRVHIGNACEVKNSIVMDETKIGHLSYVGDSIIGKGCNLGAGTLIANYRFDAKPVKMLVKEEIVDSGQTKLGVILGDGVKTGVNAALMPGVKVGNNSWIGAGVVINRDVPPNIHVSLKQETRQQEMEERKK